MAVHEMEVQEMEVQRTNRGDAMVAGAAWRQRRWRCRLQGERREKWVAERNGERGEEEEEKGVRDLSPK